MGNFFEYFFVKVLLLLFEFELELLIEFVVSIRKRVMNIVIKIVIKFVEVLNNYKNKCCFV